MKGIKIVCVVRVKEEFFKEGIGHYVKEIRKKYPMDILECPDESTPDSCPESVERQIRDTEGERILNKIKDDEYVVALCIDGKHYSTQEWGDRMNRIFLQVPSQVTFVIGGSLGLSEKVIRRANEKLSFSALTFPHQMMRLILCEQIARVV